MKICHLSILKLSLAVGLPVESKNTNDSCKVETRGLRQNKVGELRNLHGGIATLDSLAERCWSNCWYVRCWCLATRTWLADHSFYSTTTQRSMNYHALNRLSNVVFIARYRLLKIFLHYRKQCIHLQWRGTGLNGRWTKNKHSSINYFLFIA
jgi:hypothetical protein